MKTLDQYFADWEAHVFGYGYGTGEEHTLRALHKFMGLLPEQGTYDYQKLEEMLTPAVTWLLINILAHADILEYGGSPRFGWLTECGKRLKAYLATKSVNQLIDITAADDYRCHPDFCNCGKVKCNNPFWTTQ